MLLALLVVALPLTAAVVDESIDDTVKYPVDPLPPVYYPYPQEPCVCHLYKKTGPCRAYFRRWYFDQAQQTCIQFIYGGCGGNGNNFLTKQECEQSCLCPKKPYYYLTIYPPYPIKCPYPECEENYDNCGDNQICCYNYDCGKKVCTNRPAEF